jgi:hypothetical protein
MEQVILAKGRGLVLILGGMLILVATVAVTEILRLLLSALSSLTGQLICRTFFYAGRLYGWRSRKKIF